MRTPKLTSLLHRFAADPTAMAALRALPAETAHGFALDALTRGMFPPVDWRPDPILSQTLWDLPFANPLGVAAGFDKNAIAVDPLLGIGAGFVEIGAITPRPQVGNPKPRLFRLTEDKAVINRMGFNNEGMEPAADRLRARPEQVGIVGVNIGANKNSVDRMADYVSVLRHLWGLADFFTLNVSSPNTEKLRDLQGPDALRDLLTLTVAARDGLASESGTAAPLLIKLAPDLSDEEIDAIADVCRETGVDGAILTNTTTERPDRLQSAKKGEAGGLSGQPLFERSTEVLKTFARRIDGAFPLIGVGGVASAEQAYAKIRAGASLVQLYSGLVYGGVGLLTEIPDGLAALLKRDGFTSISEAVGADLHQ